MIQIAWPALKTEPRHTQATVAYCVKPHGQDNDSGHYIHIFSQNRQRFLEDTAKYSGLIFIESQRTHTETVKLCHEKKKKQNNFVLDQMQMNLDTLKISICVYEQNNTFFMFCSATTVAVIVLQIISPLTTTKGIAIYVHCAASKYEI